MVLSALGVLWIAQGTGAAKDSMMSGHPAYAGLGVVVLIIGLFLLSPSGARAALETDTLSPTAPFIR